MQELWNLMETPMHERRTFDHCSSLLSGPPDEAMKKGCLGLDIIREVFDHVYFILFWLPSIIIYPDVSQSASIFFLSIIVWS